MGVEWSITLSQYPHVREAIAHITEDGWEPIGYTEDGEAQVAETSFVASKKKGKHRRVRVVVRRTRLTDPTQAQLWPDWRYHGLDASMISKSSFGVGILFGLVRWLGVGFRGVGRVVGRCTV